MILSCWLRPIVELINKIPCLNEAFYINNNYVSFICKCRVGFVPRHDAAEGLFGDACGSVGAGTLAAAFEQLGNGLLNSSRRHPVI